MPQLKEYDAGNLTLRPTESGTDARLQAARRINAFASQAAGAITGAAEAGVTAANDVAKSASGVAEAIATGLQQQETYAGHREISKGAAAGAQLFSELTSAWDDTVKKADPNDPSVAARFREKELEPALQRFKDAYSGTDLGIQWSEQHVASMRNHFFQKTAADMSTLAGRAVEVNVREINNSNANAAFKSPDFHTVDFLLGKTETDIGAVVESSNIKGAESSKVRMDLTEKAKDQIVKSAAAGAIAKSADPEKTAQAFSDRYPQYLSGSETQAFARAAKAQAKANTLTDRQLETYARQEADRNVHRAAGKVMADNVSYDDATGRMMIKPEYFKQTLDIARQYPDAPSAAATVHAAITWGEHQQNLKAQPTISDPAVKADLYTRMFDQNNPTRLIDLQKANVENKLSTHDYNAMHQLLTTLEETPLKGPVMHDTLGAVKANLTYQMPGMPGRDPKGQEAYAKFVRDFVPKYIAASRAGAVPPNALDTSDPKSLISQSVAQFKRTPADMMRDRIEEFQKLNINLTGDGKTTGAQHVIDIPAGMAPADAVKLYGKGQTIRLPDGRTKVLQ